ncbi:GGDEF domain-containing protein [Exiguobacterium sp. KRL4]|uniref:sensor domain-containing protein n=1 Tax=Exiguobacterium sp. KRL4 TaxID=1914536 RepID=UPI0008F8206D|nr:EAL domain-containing protein [Exiguobacterium sp. KRL4]OIN66846.1 GGDEF domain-containing protein [Exiguobacterium sp. KRL4]
MPLKKGLHALLKRGQDVSVIDEHFVENHPDAIYTLDVLGRVTRLNDKTSLLLGYTRQVLTNHFKHFVHPDDQDSTVYHFQQVMQGKSETYTARIRHSKGQYLELMIVNIPIFANGLIVGAYGIARDLTTSRLMKQQMDAIQFDQQLVETLPGIALATFSEEGQLVRSSESFAELFGLHPEQLKTLSNQDLLQRIHPADQQEFREYLDLLKTNRCLSSLDIETRLLHSQYGYQDVFCRCAFHQAEHHPQAELTYVLYNLSDHKSLDKQLHAEKEKFLTFQQVSTSAIYRYDITQHKIDFHTRGFENIFDGLLHRHEQVDGIWENGLILAEDRSKVEASYQRILAHHETEVSYRIQHDGAIHWILENRTPISNPSGAVFAFQSVIQDITQLKQQEEKIFQLAMHDRVTGLPNRTLVLEQMTQWIATYPTFSVLTVSYNTLQDINHDFGYSIGDKWLSKTATQLLYHLPTASYFGHLYGDEYIILFPNVVAECSINKICEQLLELSKQKIIIDSYEWYPSIAIGVSRFPEDADSAEELVKAASIALGRARANDYSVYSSTFNIETYRRHQLQKSIRTSIRRNELFLEYQPKVNAWSGTIIGAEALIRWQHPVWGRIPPNDFISLSEESEMHILIADWVLEETCRNINQWILTGLPIVPISINVSPKRLIHGNFAETCQETLNRFGVSPSMLEIEILETDVLFDNSKIHQSLQTLSQMGIKIALDDFGKGYSSISYLQQYPIDTIKIDRQFATTLIQDKKTQSVVRSILFMAKEFGMDVVAEGVETMEQLHFLRQLQCTTIQGYLFSKPLPKADFERTMQARQIRATEAMTIATNNRTIDASITIQRLNGQDITVGRTDISVSKGTMHSVFFYSTLHLPVHEGIELVLILNQQPIPVRPIQTVELDNGLMEYECQYLDLTQSHLVFQALQSS